jgi:hypothetical protein
MPIATAVAKDDVAASILPSGELQVSFADGGVPGSGPVTYTLSAEGKVEYHCGDVFWGITSWSGPDWSTPLTATKERGRISGTLTLRIPSTDIFTPCPVGLSRTYVAFSGITITNSARGVLHADPLSAGTPVTG